MRALINEVFNLCEKGSIVQESILVNARADLAQLRAAADELREARIEAGAMDGVPLASLIKEENDTLDFLRAQVAEQARQLEEARNIFENVFDHNWSNRKLLTAMQDWLAANPAPAPQEDATK